MIKSVEIICGMTSIQKYSGSYLSAMVERDFPIDKKELFYQMSGNTKQFKNVRVAYSKSNRWQ